MIINITFRKTIAIIVLIFTSLSFTAFSQSIITPATVQWKADQNDVSLKTGFEVGIAAPAILTLELYFENSILKEVPKEKLTFEFRWFHYYSTRKDFMDSYTVPYDKEKAGEGNKFKISSSRSNITRGWWEVQVISKVDGKTVKYNDLDKFQIYVK
jgi:hypothetical protein